MKKCSLSVIVSLVAALSVHAVETGSSSLSLHLNPGIQIPLGASADYFTVGGLVNLSGEFAFTEQPRFFISTDLAYLLNPLKSGQSISALAGDIGGGVYIDFTPRLSLKVNSAVGYNLSFLNGTGSYTGSGVTSGNSLYLTAGLGFSFLLSPSLNLSLGVSYDTYLGLVNGISLALGTSYYFTGRESRLRKIGQELPARPEFLQAAKTPNPGEGIRINDIAIQPVFPVLHKYYDDHPIGTAVLYNQEDVAITDIAMSIFIKQYMDTPKECQSPKELGAGETAKVELFGLFTDKVLDITEGTKTAAEITLEYRVKDEWYRETKLETVRLYDRNAMSWDDDRKAAAFVTAKDPAVLSFAKNVVGALRGNGIWAFNANLQQAMGIHEALTLYKMQYVIDPTTPFAEFSQQKMSVDFLQFPRQTLEYRAGDCDDLSILYTALLESVGIQTAFITVPGHIFPAFCLNVPSEEAKKSFLNTADLIFFGNSTWIPVEATEREGGFIRAWEKAAKQWREYSGKGQAQFYDMHTSWETYEPVGLPGAQTEIALPADNRVVAAFQKEMTKFVQKELEPQVKKMEAEIKKGSGNPATQNKLGVLYAKYGFADKAEAEFLKILAKQQYVPTLMNVGNLYFLREKWEKALEFYERAAKKSPSNVAITLSIARVHHQLGNYGMAKKSFDTVKSREPSLAEKYAYLEAQGEQGARAAEAGSAEGVVVWQE
jgi:tetratricopeptide (TPR) repeat protein